jgi:hypothetical protein
MTQGILSEMDSDEVNHLADTTEAMQVARIIRNTFNDISDEYLLESNKELLNLEGIADTTRPTHLRIPQGVYSIERFEYDIREGADDPLNFRRLQFLEPSDFLPRVTLNNQDDVVQIVEDFGGAKFQVHTSVSPSCYTTFDNEYVVCDAIDLDISSTLMGSRTRVLATRKPTLSLTDASVIDLPDFLISLLRAEATMVAFDVFKDGAPPSIQRRANRQRVRARRLKHTIGERRPKDLLPDYGRRV